MPPLPKIDYISLARWRGARPPGDRVMRVVLIHQAFVAPDEAGGTRHYELAKRAVEQGIDFAIVASDISYLTGQRVIADGKGISEQNFDGVRVLRAYTYPSLHRS